MRNQRIRHKRPTTLTLSGSDAPQSLAPTKDTEVQLVASPHGATPRTVLLTGATGFVGQALLERLLRDFSGEIYVVVRRRGGMSAQARVDALFDKSAFDPLRAEIGAEALTALVAQRVRVIDSDLAEVRDLPAGLDVVIHSASSVKFDDGIDSAFRTNVAGPAALYGALARAGGTAHVIHVSTAYVQTNRVDTAYETPVAHSLDWRAELARAEELASLPAPERVSAGRERARELGWTDIYTLTKTMGESVATQLWGQSGRLSIVRPTIIESALRRPFPGWMDGFKVADPLIAAYAKGKLVGFPGFPSSVLDVIPVDLVVDTIIGALLLPAPAGQPAYLQIGTGASNPMHLADLRRHVQAYFARTPWRDRDGNPIHPDRWDFSEPAAFRRWVARKRRQANLVYTVTRKMRTGPGKALAIKARLGMRELDALSLYMDLYEPYATTTTVFDDQSTRQLHDRLATTYPDAVDLDVTGIDWQSYLCDTHLPALVALMEQARARRSVTRPASPSRANGAAPARPGQPLQPHPHSDEAARSAGPARERLRAHG